MRKPIARGCSKGKKRYLFLRTYGELIPRPLPFREGEKKHGMG